MTENNQDGFHAVLVVGAGNGGELAALRELGSRRLVLTEAHPDLAAELSRRIDSTRGAEVWSLAISAAQQAQATLHVCNNPRFSSLHPPRDLGRYFPNLRVTGEVEVPARSFGEVLEQIIQTDDSNNLLVLGAAGQALELIRSVPASKLQSFKWIIVRAGAVSLYDGDDAEASLTVLKTIGFDIVREDNEAIFPDRVVLLKRNDTRVHGLRLEAQLQRIAKERDEQATLAARHQAEVDRIRNDSLEREKQVTENQHTLQSRISELERNLQASSAVNAQMGEDLAAAKRTVSLSVKLQTLRESDLNELQGRYRSLLEQYEVQRDLLGKLNDKLSAASNYFHLLSHETNLYHGAEQRKHSSKRITKQKQSRKNV